MVFAFMKFFVSIKSIFTFKEMAEEGLFSTFSMSLFEEIKHFFKRRSITKNALKLLEKLAVIEILENNNLPDYLLPYRVRLFLRFAKKEMPQIIRLEGCKPFIVCSKQEKVELLELTKEISYFKKQKICGYDFSNQQKYTDKDIICLTEFCLKIVRNNNTLKNFLDIFKDFII
jgi:hypothetical protein